MSSPRNCSLRLRRRSSERGGYPEIEQPSKLQPSFAETLEQSARLPTGWAAFEIAAFVCGIACIASRWICGRNTVFEVVATDAQPPAAEIAGDDRDHAGKAGTARSFTHRFAVAIQRAVRRAHVRGLAFDMETDPRLALERERLYNGSRLTRTIDDADATDGQSLATCGCKQDDGQRQNQ